MSVSIIIPFYNSSKFINKTLKSVIEQTHTDIEVICVNDGSSDNTLKLLNDWKSKDERIKVIDKENGGIESSLKIGTTQITKEYTFLLGHDDTLSKDAIEKAYNEFKREDSIDAVRMRLVAIDENDNILNTMEGEKILSGFEALDRTIMQWRIHTFCLWKTAIFSRINDISTGLMNFDELATRYLYTLCNKVSFCSGEYYYLQHQESVTKKISPRLLDAYVIESHIKQLLESCDKYHIYKSEFEKYMFHKLQNMISLYFNLKKERFPLTDKDLNKVKLLYNSIDFKYLKRDTSAIESIKYHLLYSCFTIFYYYKMKQ